MIYSAQEDKQTTRLGVEGIGNRIRCKIRNINKTADSIRNMKRCEMKDDRRGQILDKDWASRTTLGQDYTTALSRPLFIPP